MVPSAPIGAPPPDAMAPPPQPQVAGPAIITVMQPISVTVMLAYNTPPQTPPRWRRSAWTRIPGGIFNIWSSIVDVAGFKWRFMVSKEASIPAACFLGWIILVPVVLFGRAHANVNEDYRKSLITSVLETTITVVFGLVAISFIEAVFAVLSVRIIIISAHLSGRSPTPATHGLRELDPCVARRILEVHKLYIRDPHRQAFWTIWWSFTAMFFGDAMLNLLNRGLQGPEGYVGQLHYINWIAGFLGGLLAGLGAAVRQVKRARSSDAVTLGIATAPAAIQCTRCGSCLNVGGGVLPHIQIPLA